MSGIVKKADVIIVFGAAVYRGGLASPALARRVIHAVDLMKNDVSGHLLFTGGTGKYPPAEAVVMKKLAMERGVPPSCITLEDKAKSTYKSVKYCLAIMRQKNWTSAMTVSDSYHLFRIRFTFRCLGIEVEASPSTSGRPGNCGWRWYVYYFREAAAVVYYSARLLIERLRSSRHGSDRAH